MTVVLKHYASGRLKFICPLPFGNASNFVGCSRRFSLREALKLVRVGGGYTFTNYFSISYLLFRDGIDILEFQNTFKMGDVTLYDAPAYEGRKR